MSVPPEKAIIDLNDQELREALRKEADNRKREQLRQERDFRSGQSQDENTKALNRWTFWIAIATFLSAIAAVLGSIATCLLVLRAFGKL